MSTVIRQADEPTVAVSKESQRPAWVELLRRMLGKIGPSTIAVLCWLIATPATVYIIRILDLDPLTLRGAVIPVAAGAVGAAIAIGVALKWTSHRLAGAIAGLYASWIAMVLLNALHGTPFGHYALFNGDAVRLTALATRFSTTWTSADAFLPWLPTEYPPLYPWLIGRAALLLDRPAWTVVGDAEVLFISGAVLAAFLLWKRLVGAPAALAMAAIAPVIFTDPHKSYEILTLAVFTPWVLATFTGLPRDRGGLHWLPAGIIGGLFVCTYTGYLMFGAIGVAAVVIARLFRPERGRYLLHLALTLLTGSVVSSWYVLPLLYGYLTMPRNVVADTYPNADITADPVALPFLDPTPLGLLALAGIVGLLWYRTREWWAQPMLLLTAGVYLYWLFFALRLVQNGHTGFFVKTPRMISILLAAAGILTMLRAAGPICRRLGVVPPRAVGVAALSVLLVWTGLTAWREWTPGDPRGFKDIEPAVKPANLAPDPGTRAHLEPLPDTSLPRFGPVKPHRKVVPVEEVQREVAARYGPRARPMTLSVEMRLFAFLPWYCYQQNGEYSANSLMRYTDRNAELKRLTEITDPARFADASAHTKFGKIDVFLLRKRADGWRFSAKLTFAPQAFRGKDFHIVDGLPEHLVLAIRNR